MLIVGFGEIEILLRSPQTHSTEQDLKWLGSFKCVFAEWSQNMPLEDGRVRKRLEPEKSKKRDQIIDAVLDRGS